MVFHSGGVPDFFYYIFAPRILLFVEIAWSFLWFPFRPAFTVINGIGRVAAWLGRVLGSVLLTFRLALLLLELMNHSSIPAFLFRRRSLCSELSGAFCLDDWREEDIVLE